MKKLLLLLVIIIYIFSCNYADDSKKTDKDSTLSKKDDSMKLYQKKVDTFKKTRDITFYELDENTAVKMRQWVNACPQGNRKTPRRIFEIPGIKQAIKDKNPGCTFDMVQARIKDTGDEDFYCKINNYGNHRENCKVKNNKIWLYRVTCPGFSETYYMFLTLCPPPVDCFNIVDTAQSP